MALEKAAKSPLFPLNLRLLSQKLKFWESLQFKKNASTLCRPENSQNWQHQGLASGGQSLYNHISDGFE
jgi:hypothetical protein